VTGAGQLDPEQLRRQLEKRGVLVLAVTDHVHPGQLLVFLHGNDGRINQEDAVRALAGLPGVTRVVESPQTWTILTVHLNDQATDTAER
jgi:hypothetical protein